MDLDLKVGLGDLKGHIPLMDAILQGDMDAMGFWNDMPEEQRVRHYECARVLGHVFETDLERKF